LADLRRFGIGIQVGQKSISIGGGSLCKIVNESFYCFPAGVAKDWRSAIVSGKGFHEGGIEMVLTDQHAETIA
jgi:hypothetical protein